MQRRGQYMQGSGYRRQGGGMDIFLMAMIFQAWQRFQQMERKPPATLGIIALNVLLFFKPAGLLDLLPIFRGAQAVCLNPVAVIERREIYRLLSSAFVHLDEYHLVINMTSLLLNGYNLEHRLGTLQFLQTTLLLLILTHCVVIASCLAAATILPHSYMHLYYHMCACGISGVLFALKMVLNYHSPGTTSFFGFANVPTKYAAWAELLFMQLMGRGSFLVHVSGIIAGLMYIHRGPFVQIIQPALRVMNPPRPLPPPQPSTRSYPSPSPTPPSRTQQGSGGREEWAEGGSGAGQYKGDVGGAPLAAAAAQNRAEQAARRGVPVRPTESSSTSNKSGDRPTRFHGSGVAGSPTQVKDIPVTEDELRRRRLARFK
mmetsp:Transcript_27894/g.38556  ORF Transcript_27894/g.38556 Transcript_27894/m.38556 type:complete len:373 (+) Transcript_27894:63-1181(+)